MFYSIEYYTFLGETLQGEIGNYLCLMDILQHIHTTAATAVAQSTVHWTKVLRFLCVRA